MNEKESSEQKESVILEQSIHHKVPLRSSLFDLISKQLFNNATYNLCFHLMTCSGHASVRMFLPLLNNYRQ